MARYKIETLRSYTSKAQERLNHYLNMTDNEFKDVHVALSKGDSKIGNTINNALLPILSCGNCTGCKDHCYDVKACMRFPQALENRAKNQAIAMREPDRYFKEITEAMTAKRKDKSMRWHQGGEILNTEYLNGMVYVANNRPDYIAWTYTHMHSIVNNYVADGGKIPANLSIMFSAEDDKPINNPYGFPEFRCITKGNTPPAGFMECKGNCEYCKTHKTGCPYGMNVYAWEH